MKVEFNQAKYYYKLVYKKDLPKNFPWLGIELDIKDGFIHLVEYKDIEKIYNKFFSNTELKNTVYIIAINKNTLNYSKLKIEVNPNGVNKYPHYYDKIYKKNISTINKYNLST